jgi:hypothetical protein
MAGLPKDRLFRRIRKKAKRGMRGWPGATICFYGPNASRATKVVVGIVPSEHEEVRDLRDWTVTTGDVRNDEGIAAEILDHMDTHGILSVIMTDGVIGCPHQTGIDYDGDWCPDPACVYWYKRDRFTGKMVQ